MLKFTLLVKAAHCDSIKQKSMAVVEFETKGCLVKFMDTKRVRDTRSVSIHPSVCIPFHQSSSFPTLQTND